ncbi:hypothetical protein PVL29_021136 [Vitis rotundifolia]|uniref:Uncharacterized protein n=1 Tax=Vitis rotundifolia TaxID=103349 RepID=A0AA38YYL9_VITRO|nr:hypothetical protein PVL29_021136 [Vitis rotundifolia]
MSPGHHSHISNLETPSGIYGSGLPSNSFLSSTSIAATFINHAAAPSISTLNPVKGEPSCNSVLKTRQTNETLYTSIESGPLVAAQAWPAGSGLCRRKFPLHGYRRSSSSTPKYEWASLFLGSLLLMAAKTRTV